MPALNIGVYILEKHENILMNKFPLGPQDEIGPRTTIGQSHKIIVIHREAIGLTPAQADLLDLLKKKYGAKVNIDLTDSLLK